MTGFVVQRVTAVVYMSCASCALVEVEVFDHTPSPEEIAGAMPKQIRACHVGRATVHHTTVRRRRSA